MSTEVAAAASAAPAEAVVTSVDPSSVGMSMDENGQLNFAFETPDPPAAEPAPKAEEPVVEAPPAEPVVNWEKRYKDAQAELTRKSQALAELERARAEGAAPATTPAAPAAPTADAQMDALFAQIEENGTLDMLSDPKQFKQFFRALVEKGVELKVGEVRREIMPFVLDHQVNQEYLAAYAKYGDAFLEAMPMIRQVIVKAPAGQIPTFEQAFEFIQSVRSSAQTSTQETPAPEARPAAPAATPAAPTPPAPQPAPSPSAAELAARADRLASTRSGADTGRAGSKVESVKQARTIKEAFDQGVSEIVGD